MNELMQERDRLVRELNRADDYAAETMSFARYNKAAKALADFDAAHPEIAAAATPKAPERDPGHDEAVARKLRMED